MTVPAEFVHSVVTLLSSKPRNAFALDGDSRWKAKYRNWSPSSGSLRLKAASALDFAGAMPPSVLDSVHVFGESSWPA